MQLHNTNLANLKRIIYGTSQTTATRKVTLNRLLKLDVEQKDQFMVRTNDLIGFVCNVVIKTQMFVNYYFMKQLEHDSPQLTITETRPSLTTPSTTGETRPPLATTLAAGETRPPSFLYNGNYMHFVDLIQAGGIFVLWYLLATGRIQSGVSINVQGNLISGGDINIKNDAIVQGNLACDGNVTVGAKILAGGDVFTSRGMVCGESINVSKTLTSVGEMTWKSIIVSGSLNSNGGSMNISGSLNSFC
ncbi:hypothetical protein BC941DRAFT_140244 [Chlamydoabsidia padenii]|nr:hypothetical protein BC941DRAFT_140244 [Chlamydoabsidia padenii]